MKKLSHSSNQGMKEFMNEAKLLARVQHRNVVNLLGYCVHGEEKLLVYEYVSNESLDKFIFSKFSVTLNCFPVLGFFFSSFVFYSLRRFLSSNRINTMKSYVLSILPFFTHTCAAQYCFSV